MLWVWGQRTSLGRCSSVCSMTAQRSSRGQAATVAAATMAGPREGEVDRHMTSCLRRLTEDAVRRGWCVVRGGGGGERLALRWRCTGTRRRDWAGWLMALPGAGTEDHAADLLSPPTRARPDAHPSGTSTFCSWTSGSPPIPSPSFCAVSTCVPWTVPRLRLPPHSSSDGLSGRARLPAAAATQWQIRLRSHRVLRRLWQRQHHLVGRP